MTVGCSLVLSVGSVSAPTFAQAIAGYGPSHAPSAIYDWLSPSVKKVVAPGETIAVTIAGYTGRVGAYAGEGLVRLRNSASLMTITILKG
jgi:hypothetical protein